MLCVAPVPELLQFGYCSRRILVLEPADVTWLGLYRLIEMSDKKGISLVRVPSVDKLAEWTHHYAPDMLLLTSVSRRDEIYPLLQQLCDITPHHPFLHIVAFLKQDMPYLAELLTAFGVTSLFMQLPPLGELVDIMTNPAHLPPKERATQLTRQERNVAKALLCGYSVSHLARLLGKNVRTISAQKQSVIHKLHMSHTGELQVLGGRLMTTERRAAHEQTV